MGSPTSRTIDWFKARGHYAGVVERWIPQARKRIDLLGFIDIVAVTDRLIGIQATAFPALNQRVKKICEDRCDEAKAWLDAGGLIEIWTWTKLQRMRTLSNGRQVKLPTWVPRVTKVDYEVLSTHEYDWSEVEV